MATDDGFRGRRGRVSDSITDGWLGTYFFFFLFKSKPQIGLKAAIHNLSGEAGI